jgi:uncharacterized glyoxalase superfamily metalloenzyme YdcJ
MTSPTSLVAPDAIRAMFSDAMSNMYRAEVPLYGDLIAIVDDANRAVLARDPALETALRARGETDRLGTERHGAIRLGTAAELSMMRRAFAVMGMHPVGYYDLAAAGVPVHSTAFRPIEPQSLNRNPFRVFTSLLRLDLIADEALRETVRSVLARRRIFTEEAERLILRHEREGVLGAADAERFVAEVLGTFRWHADALVDAATYRRLLDAHRVVADVVSFKGPHINHLTPRTLDIDAVQEEMGRRGIAAKSVIEGPPRRRVPILLRQTSFKALSEAIRFPGEGQGDVGTHTARFGEVEQRGAALTAKGRGLYDRLLEEARAGEEGSYALRLQRAFEAFPDDHAQLRREGLAFYRYETTETGKEAARSGVALERDMEALIEAGWVTAEPLTYEDFLPVSAAGIFQSNLGEGEQRHYSASAARAAFEADLGVPVADEIELYAAEERRSLEKVRSDLRLATAGTRTG